MEVSPGRRRECFWSAGAATARTSTHFHSKAPLTGTGVDQPMASTNSIDSMKLRLNKPFIAREVWSSILSYSGSAATGLTDSSE